MTSLANIYQRQGGTAHFIFPLRSIGAYGAEPPFVFILILSVYNLLGEWFVITD